MTKRRTKTQSPPVAFTYKGRTFFLPEVAISSKLRKRADKAYRRLQRKAKAQWNPSWSDVDENADSRTIKQEPKDTPSDLINNRSQWENLGNNSAPPTNTATSTKRQTQKTLKKPFKNWGVEAPEQHQDPEPTTSVTPPPNLESDLEQYECLDCHKVFTKSIHLTLHKKIHARMEKQPESSYNCGSCGRTFERHNQLKIHRNICKRMPDTPKDHKIETPELLEPVILSCEKCSRTFDRPNQLKFHAKMCRADSKPAETFVKDPEPQSFACASCDRKFDRSMQLKFHTKLCKNTRPQILKVSRLASHAEEPINQVHDTDAQSVLKCEKCSRVFDRPNQLKLHTRVCKADIVVKNQTPLALTCLKCNRVFDRDNQLKFHTKLCKAPLQKEKLYSVTNSDARIQKQETSDDANLPHPDLSNKVDTPNTSGASTPKTFPPKTPQDFLKYFNSQLVSLTESCRTCSRTFLKTEITEHTYICCKDVTQQVFHKCNVCGKKFKDDDLLEKHKVLHDFGMETFEFPTEHFLFVTLPLKCTAYNCNNRFSDMTDLEDHVQSTHSKKLSNPTFYCITDTHKPPINPYVLLRKSIRELAETNNYDSSPDSPNHVVEEQNHDSSSGSEYSPTGPLKYRTRKKKRRGAKPRLDIPYQSVYSCAQCPKKFHERTRYMIHLHMHKVTEKFTCKKCDRKFYNQVSYDDHMHKHQLDPNYVSTPGRRGRFREDIPLADTYTCDQCNKTFDQRNYYIIHLSQHKREALYSCTVCERKLPTEAQFTAHMELHKDPNYVFRRRTRELIPHQSVYNCEVCSMEFTDRTAYLIHRREEKNRCDVCGRGFQSQAQLDTHKLRHDPSYVGGRRGPRKFIPFQDSYTCDTCEATIINRDEYLEHLQTHKKTYSYNFPCDQCHLKFNSNSGLLDHKQKHLDPNYVPRHPKTYVPVQDIYWCEDCEKVISTRKHYIVHRFNHRRGLIGKNRTPRSDVPVQDTYKCEDCDKVFTHRIKFIQHRYLHKDGRKVSAHKGRRSSIPFQDVYYCEQCNFKKSFTDRIKYYHHIRNHKLERTHRCDGCLKAYKTPAARDIHREKFCKGVPCKFKCSRCSDRFHNKITLARHFQRFHSKSLETTEPEVEYPCNLCSQTFNTTFGLTRHTQVYHPTEEVAVESNIVGVEEEARGFEENNDSMHSWDDTRDDDEEMPHPLLAANLCQTELVEKRVEEEQEHREEEENHGDEVPDKEEVRNTRCFCLSYKKYATQKICSSQRCACCQAGARCGKSCNCDSACMNTDEKHDAQMQMFKEGRDSLAIQEDNEQVTDPDPAPVTKFIPTSEFISVGDDEDESMKQLSFEGFVEGADYDPLADSLEDKATPVKHIPATKPPNIAIVTPLPHTSKTEPVKQTIKLVTPDNLTPQDTMRCQFCKKVLKFMPVFISHVLLHDVEKSALKCPICEKEFDHVMSYVNHLEMHNKGTDLQCKKCSSKFKSEADMKKHLEVHHFRPMECGACMTKFQNSALMMQHWSKAHPTCQCGLCNLKFFSYDDLTYHMKSLHSPYDCLRCNERFDTLPKLMDHFTQVHCQTRTQQYLPMFTCSFCSARFSDHQDYNEHLSKHLTNKNNRQTQYQDDDPPINDNIEAQEVLTCPKCGKGFNRKNGWKIHVLAHNLLVCTCDTVLETNQEFLAHVQANKCAVNCCEICGFSRNFRDPKHLLQHMQVAHGQPDYVLKRKLPNSFPVIVGSTSLAEKTPERRSSVEEIVLD